MVMMLLLLHTGALVLLYLYNTHYAMRGGCSSDGSLCGIFFVFAAAGAGYTNWARSTALK